MDGFLNKIDNTIIHYNHDAGEYTRSGFTNLGNRFLTIYPVGFVIQRFRAPIRWRRDTYG